MRGEERRQRSMLLVVNLEERIPKQHPLTRIKQMAELALRQLSPIFDEIYSVLGRPSIPPERLLKASLLMALYTIRSERLFCEQLDYNLLFRWFLDMELDEPSFDHSSFGANRKRLLEREVAGQFFRQTVAQAQALGLLSHEHFTVDGTLIEAWASLKSFKRKDEKAGSAPDDPGNPTVNFHGEHRSNATHQSTTDPEALADERLAGSGRITLAGDKGYDTHGFVASCRALKITPHVAQNHTRPGGSALDARTTRHPGYAVSQWMRKRIEEGFGWMKTVGGLRKTRYRGRERVQMHAYLVGAAYNLLRIARLLAAPA